MSDVLVVAEVAEGKLKKTTHSAVAFARRWPRARGSYVILVIGGVAPRRGRSSAPPGCWWPRTRRSSTTSPSGSRPRSRLWRGFGVVVERRAPTARTCFASPRLGAGYVADTELIVDGGALTSRRLMFAGNAYGL